MTTDRASPFNDLRRSGARLLAGLFWINVPVLWFAGLALGSANTGIVTLFAVLLSALPSVMVLGTDRYDASARLALGITAVSYPALFVFLFQGHLWQMDLHMYFFAALASLTVLCDKRAILAAAGLTALHHLVLNFSAPEWVFSGAEFTGWGDLPRVLLHAVIVIMQTAVLLWLTDRLQRGIVGLAGQAEASEALRIEADAARARSDEALAALQEAQRADELRRAAEDQVRAAQEAAERRRFVADEIEERFGAIVVELGQMAERLSNSKAALTATLSATVQRSAELRSSHEQAEKDVQAMATDTEQLAASIRMIGRSSDATRETVSASAQVARELPAKVADLDSTVDAANGILQLISNIASQSNILALNATIEAARGGQANSGFVVVAHEIKTLSQQTAGAVEQIAAHLEDIRGAVAAVAEAISTASVSASAVDQSAATIAQVVQEQVTATSDLAAMAEQMAQHVALAANEAHAMVESISTAHGEMDETGRIASVVADCTQNLHDTVHNVLAELRAA
ncbi:MAG TPA: methyl-accepting chemotaxis protein [Croceibacterium sp.]|nr:methyl-accepting chemotaxis protein [Croceibacterium sp.]